METNPLVSIIINNYNYDRFLAEAIDSALNQTYPHTEVIVVDDGSTDNSRQTIAEYSDRIITILQPNGKQASAFNSGFANSKGEIIIFLDSDDYLFPNAVEKIVTAWQPNFSKVHYRLAVVDAERKSLSYTFPQGDAPLSKGDVEKTLLELGSYIRVPTSGNALSRHALEPLFPIANEFKLTADDYLSVLVPFAGEVGAIEEPLGAYRIHGSNQWALAEVTGDRLHRFIKHDLVVSKLLINKAQELEYQLSPDFELRFLGRFQVRLASIRLSSDKHPIPEDNRFYLMYSGIKCIWKYTSFNWLKKIIHTIWFLGIGLMPLSIAKIAINWFFTPHLRPKLLHKIHTSIT